MAPQGSDPQQVTHHTVRVQTLFFYVLHQLNEIESFLLHSSFISPSEGNSEEVQVGKISFTPSEVLGHGTAGTFVFRCSVCILTQCCFNGS